MPKSSRSRLWVVPLLVLIAWLVVGGLTGPKAGQLSEVTENDTGAFLPSSAESTKVADVRGDFAGDTTPAVIVWESDQALGGDAPQQAADQLDAVAGVDGVTGVSPVQPSEDGQALVAYAEIEADDEEVEQVVADVRDQLDDVGDATVYVTGGAAFAADLGSAFGGIDGILLVVALVVVLLILLVVYRSPVLPFAVLLTAVLALGAASSVVYALAESGVLLLDGQAQGIMSILVVGAATDYALLLVARYREELRAFDSRYDAMRASLAESWKPIAASGGTVILALLCLLLSDLTSNRSLGPVAAIGIAGAMVAALTFLPALLLLLGRSAFWPFRPKSGTTRTEEHGVWARVAGLVSRRPRRVWVLVTLGLVVAAAFVPAFKASGVPQTELFLGEVEAVEGQAAVGRHFAAGSGDPALVVAPQEDLDQVVSTAQDVAGVARVAPVTSGGRGDVEEGQAQPAVVDGDVMVEVTLADAAYSRAAEGTVRDLRTELHAVSDDVLVGGPTAQQIDSIETAERDRALIIPVVLVVILLVLIVLLRSVLAPVLLVATTVLSFFATLGVAGLVFDHLFGWPGADPSVPLYAFVFLVALGIDYNIFLMTRVREETQKDGTRRGVLTALIVTGGVITSAGIVLAATFGALAVIPLLFLAQIAFLVPFGVLLDTLLVRTLLVPAVTYDVGARIWWPSALQRRE
ncbi:RND superfamily putative drug exporter [Mumia flava]|uniref:RND superfamily putative drug exporter n=1 Tax=Mumia flava TaxID=1348852 RepID=A0A0B2BRL4_9ACTN|nr:MMPL family transporter [Mumia flava]PJJ56887.1 RND superfamily putative drug exporter [Mumia flava]